jgi:hypothetical protein
VPTYVVTAAVIPVVARRRATVVATPKARRRRVLSHGPRHDPPVCRGDALSSAWLDEPIKRWMVVVLS